MGINNAPKDGDFIGYIDSLQEQKLQDLKNSIREDNEVLKEELLQGKLKSQRIGNKIQTQILDNENVKPQKTRKPNYTLPPNYSPQSARDHRVQPTPTPGSRRDDPTKPKKTPAYINFLIVLSAFVTFAVLGFAKSQGILSDTVYNVANGIVCFYIFILVFILNKLRKNRRK